MQDLRGQRQTVGHLFRAFPVSATITRQHRVIQSEVGVTAATTRPANGVIDAPTVSTASPRSDDQVRP